MIVSGRGVVSKWVKHTKSLGASRVTPLKIMSVINVEFTPNLLILANDKESIGMKKKRLQYINVSSIHLRTNKVQGIVCE